MAAERENGAISDTEGTEKPVREQFKKASISKALNSDAPMVDEGDAEVVASAPRENGDEGDTIESRGRLQRKRSHEEFESEGQSTERAAPGQTATRHHTRKRSRDSTAEEVELNNGQRKSGERSRGDSDPDMHTGSNGDSKAATTQRPLTPEHAGDKSGEIAVEAMSSPKTKRTRLHPATEENGTEQASIAPKVATSTENPAIPFTEPSAPEEKPAATKVPPTSGFANFSESSPFASLARSQSPQSEQPPVTSPSAFAASGFGSLSGSAASGFGSVGKSTGGFGAGGSFATRSLSPPVAPAASEKEIETGSGSTFGGALGQRSTFLPSTGVGSSTSAFGQASSGFGSLSQGGSAFGRSSAFGGFSAGGSGGLTSFASGKPLASLAGPSKPTTKAFGAPADDEPEGEEGGDGPEDDSGFKSPLSQDSDKQDTRFYHQDLETGEEDETTEYSCRAKLYNFVPGADGKKEWKERGLGVVRLNLRKLAPGEEDDAKPRARLLMRAEGSHRVILNTPVKKELKFGAPTGGAPQGGYVYFMGAVDGKSSLELLQLKIRQQFALELYDKIVDLQEAM